LREIEAGDRDDRAVDRASKSPNPGFLGVSAGRFPPAAAASLTLTGDKPRAASNRSASLREGASMPAEMDWPERSRAV
jgi:hypothetical protein